MARLILFDDDDNEFDMKLDDYDTTSSTSMLLLGNRIDELLNEAGEDLDESDLEDGD